jgi:HPr kinase/phosphorylase
MVTKIVHGTAIALEDKGVLLIGPSGSGKSDLALRLIDSGATLISDDQIICERRNDEIFLFPHKKINGLIEVRGVGIIKVPYIENVKLKMIVQLINEQPERIPVKEEKNFLNLKIKFIKIIGKEASSTAKVKIKLFEEIIDD